MHDLDGFFDAFANQKIRVRVEVVAPAEAVDELVGLALYLSPVWDPDNQDDVAAAKAAVRAFQCREPGP